MSVQLPVKNPDKAAVLKVFPDWGSYLPWINGKYGFDNITGHEIGLIEPLVRELLDLAAEYDAGFNQNDPENDDLLAPDIGDRLGAISQRVRDELDDEWVVVGHVSGRPKRIVLRKTGDPRPVEEYHWEQYE